MTEFTDKFMAFYILNEKLDDLLANIDQAFVYTTDHNKRNDREKHVIALTSVRQYIKEAYRITNAFLHRLEREAKQ